MKNKELLLILDSDGKYRQKRNQYESIDINIFIDELKFLGYTVKTTNYFNIAGSINDIKNKHIVYTASQNKHYKKYIEDIIYSLSLNNYLIPGYESLIGQENKNYQEIQRKQLKLDTLKSYLISDLNDIKNIDIKYPIIVKKPNTCSSRGVFKANDSCELNKIINRHFIYKDVQYYLLTFKKIIKKICKIKSYVWTDAVLKEYKYTRLILQEFISELDGDFKVLVYGNKYYTLKRGIKPGDFKASGSGIRDVTCEPPLEVLNFAKKCFDKLEVPFAGLDISIDKNNNCNLIEFQSIHIGPVTLIDSDKYYTYENKKWIKHEESSILEKEYAYAIDWYIKKNIKKGEKKL